MARTKKTSAEGDGRTEQNLLEIRTDKKALYCSNAYRYHASVEVKHPKTMMNVDRKITGTAGVRPCPQLLFSLRADPSLIFGRIKIHGHGFVDPRKLLIYLWAAL